MKVLAIPAAFAAVITLQACTTTDAVSLPFDLASTTGDAASSSSGGGGDSTAALQTERFVMARIDAITRDAARGSGEDLQALAQLLNERDPQTFALWTQRNYASLFENLSTPLELLARIEEQR